MKDELQSEEPGAAKPSLSSHYGKELSSIAYACDLV